MITEPAEKMRTNFPAVEVGVDRYELETAIEETFVTALGKPEVVGVYVSRFPYEYGAIVVLRNKPSPEAEALAVEEEERFRTAGIHVGILLRRVKLDRSVGKE